MSNHGIIVAVAKLSSLLYWIISLQNSCIVSSTSISEGEEKVEEEGGCSLFLAESSIPNSGFGVYTTSGYTKGSEVSSDIAIPMADILRHLGENAEFIRWTHDDYNWIGDFQTEYVLAEEVDINAFPLGSLTNFHTYLSNIHPTGYGYDDSLHSREKDPGVGAYTYSSRVVSATRDIKAGEELFSNYGEKWLDDHHINVPKLVHYHKAGRILEEMSDRLTDEDTASMTSDHIDSLQKIVSIFDFHTASLLPKTLSSLKEATVEKIAWETVTPRSMDWIKQNGKCLDNIYPDKSTIPQAGRGAFAQRSIKKGELITPIPLLQIMNKTNATMYGTTTTHNGYQVRDEDDVIGQHLLLNYCFTHAESSILLCPSTYGALINHDSANPNAMYKWSSSWDSTTQQWLQMTYTDIEDQHYKGLSLDIIATRDILPGEEIFFNYGIEWETAWNKHVQTYTPDLQKTSASSFQMNADSHPIRTVTEQTPYPSNIMTVCYYHEDVDKAPPDGDSIIQPLMSDYEEDDSLLFDYQQQLLLNTTLTITQSVQNYSIPFHDLINSIDNNAIFEAKSYWPCKAYEQTSSEYTVRIYQSPVYEDTEWTEHESYKFVTNYPRKFIHFVNRPYQSDSFLGNAFRHAIHIRDDLFPPAWKNIS